jgi:poly(A) polymerase
MQKRATFINHDIESARMAEDILKRLKLPNDLIKNTVEPIENHMRMFQLPKMKNIHKIRKMLGLKTFDILELLSQADEAASLREDGSRESVIHDFVVEAKSKFGTALPSPIVQGCDLIALGHKPSPKFKFVLDHLFDLQLNGDTDKESLLSKVGGLFKEF